MQIGVQQDYKANEQYPGIIYAIEPDEGQYGPSLKWLIWDDANERTMVVFTPQMATPRNKLGRILVALTGELTSIDTDELVGATVNVQYTQSKTDATKVSASGMTARTPDKGEKVGELVEKAQAAEAKRKVMADLEAPF